ANQPSSVDIWTAGIAQYDPLLKLNMFTQVPWQKLWPERIVPQQIGADGYSLGISTGTPGVLYNVSSGADFAQVKTIDDLLKPQYKGRFGTTAFVNGFDAMSAKGWEGEAKMADYIPKLGRQAQGVLNCGGQDRVASGEFQALVLDCTGGYPNIDAYRGKLALAVPADSAQLQYYEILIPKNAASQRRDPLRTLSHDRAGPARHLQWRRHRSRLFPRDQHAQIRRRQRGEGHPLPPHRLQILEGQSRHRYVECQAHQGPQGRNGRLIRAVELR